MAMACFGLVTFLPLRPDLSLPFFISRISVSTFLPAEGEYFRPEDFFFDEDFFVLVLRREPLFFALVLRREVPEVRLRPLLDDFFEAFLVAMPILLKNQMFFRFESVAWYEGISVNRVGIPGPNTGDLGHPANLGGRLG
jgi:hypothetical protein